MEANQKFYEAENATQGCMVEDRFLNSLWFQQKMMLLLASGLQSFRTV